MLECPILKQAVDPINQVIAQDIGDFESQSLFGNLSRISVPLQYSSLCMMGNITYQTMDLFGQCPRTQRATVDDYLDVLFFQQFKTHRDALECGRLVAWMLAFFRRHGIRGKVHL